MPEETLIFGPPGCGKTHTMIEIVRKELANGTPPDRIGFVSFSRKSIEEARNRAGAELNLGEKDLPWFKTLHSIGFNWLGMKPAETIGPGDFKALGEMLGMAFDTNTADSLDEGMVPMSRKEGNRYLEVIARSKLKCISLEEEFNHQADYDLYWSMMTHLDETYSMYKSEQGKFDYTDMVEMFVQQGTAPTLDVLIVDEAQDLTPLQWRQVDVLKRSAKRVWYAGDDDQCIHRWNGVDIGSFMNACDNKHVLGQSYRVPRSVFQLANQLANRINYRHPKEWQPRDADGSVNYSMHWYDVDIDDGSWTIMARTNMILNYLQTRLKEEGYFYERYGNFSFSQKDLKAMRTWDLLVEGKSIGIKECKEMYERMPKQGEGALLKRGAAKTFDAVDPDGFHNYDNLVAEHGLLAPKELDGATVVALSEEERYYLSAIKRRGESLEKPRIKLSTIHRMKGGEDDNILLLTDSSYPAVQNPDQDDEHRVFYTAVTRARKNLHIVQSNSKYRYEI